MLAGHQEDVRVITTALRLARDPFTYAFLAALAACFVA